MVLPVDVVRGRPAGAIGVVVLHAVGDMQVDGAIRDLIGEDVRSGAVAVFGQAGEACRAVDHGAAIGDRPRLFGEALVDAPGVEHAVRRFRHGRQVGRHVHVRQGQGVAVGHAHVGGGFRKGRPEHHKGHEQREYLFHVTSLLFIPNAYARPSVAGRGAGHGKRQPGKLPRFMLLSSRISPHFAMQYFSKFVH